MFVLITRILSGYMSYIYFFDKSSWKRIPSNWKTFSNFYWKTMISHISGFFMLFFHQILSPDKPVNPWQTVRGCYPNSFRFRCPFHVVFIPLIHAPSHRRRNRGIANICKLDYAPSGSAQGSSVEPRKSFHASHPYKFSMRSL